MRCIQLQGLRFGEGLPKLCVPLTGNGMPALLSELQQVADLPADLFEWRLDCFFGNPLPVLPQVLENLGDKPLLCTLRTQGEGGQARLSPEEYERRLVDLLQTGGISVVLSKHDFHQTPPKEEIAATLRRMKALGADLPKYAVMPRTPGDVLALLAATWEASSEIGPVITMSMGELGKITRAGGGVFGSCLTFGAGLNASAPGQIDAENLRAILEDLQPYDSGARGC